MSSPTFIEIETYCRRHRCLICKTPLRANYRDGEWQPSCPKSRGQHKDFERNPSPDMEYVEKFAEKQDSLKQGTQFTVEDIYKGR